VKGFNDPQNTVRHCPEPINCTGTDSHTNNNLALRQTGPGSDKTHRANLL